MEFARKPRFYHNLLKSIVKMGSSIYGRVVIIISLLSLVLFASFGLIFQTVCEQNLNTIILQNSNNIGSLVEGALYKSMFENDKKSLQNTLDVINTLPGISDVNLYNNKNDLAYSSFYSGEDGHIDPNCKNCHRDFHLMFPAKSKSYRIIDADSECKMSHQPDGYRHLLISSPILNERSCNTSACHAHSENEEVLGSLIIKIPLKELDQAVYGSFLKFYILAILTTILFSAFMILFTRKNIKNPLNSLIRVSEDVSKGNLDIRIPAHSGQLEDMKMVSSAFNNMLDNLQKATTELENWSQQLEYKVQKKSEELGAVQNEIIHIERLASLGKLSSSVAHEINNPLSGILIYTKLIHKQLSNPELSDSKRESMLKHLTLIEQETKRCGDIVKGLLDFSKKDQDDFEPKHLHEVLQETYELMLHPVKIANIEFIKDFGATSDLIYCSPNQIKQACVALIVNATEAIRENGEIRIVTHNPDPENLRLEITDNGVGISEDDLPHIFEPFYSTKQETSRIGLGLSVVHGIMHSHKSRIQVNSEPGTGTTIIITFPLIVE